MAFESILKICKIIHLIRFYLFTSISVHLLSSYFGSSHAKSPDYMKNITSVINDLLNRYDTQLRPNFGGEPCYIGLDMTVGSFDSLNEVRMDYTITVYLNQYWKDDRLAFGTKEDSLTLPAFFTEDIWVPDTFFANDKISYLHDVIAQNKMVRLRGDGAVMYSMRFTTTMACLMNLVPYPLDTQNCPMEIISYGYTVNDVVLYWRNPSVVGLNDLELGMFVIVNYETTEETQSLATGNYTKLSVMISLSRKIGYFIFQTYLPSSLIVQLSWVTFWINPAVAPARVGLGITTVLTMTMISSGIRSSLPRIPSVKAIDIYVIVCFVFVFAALTEYAAVNYLTSQQNAKLKRKSIQEMKPTLTPQTPQASTSNNTKNGLDQAAETVTSTRETDETNNEIKSKISNLRNKIIQSSLYRKIKQRPSFTAKRKLTPSKAKFTKFTRRRQIIDFMKTKLEPLKEISLEIEDVNIIDKYSRVIFPLTFLFFNLVYWTVYSA